MDEARLAPVYLYPLVFPSDMVCFATNPVNHGFYMAWLLSSLCAHMDLNRDFDLLKAIGYILLFLYEMVAHITVRKDGVNQGFRFVEGIWLHR